MGDGLRIPGSLGRGFNLGQPALRRPPLLKRPVLQPLKETAEDTWDAVVEFIDPASLKAMLNEIYASERWASADKTDRESNVMDPKEARLPHTTRERDARRPTEKATLVLKDPQVSFDDGILNGVASFVLELPTEYPRKFDSPTPIRVQLKSPRLGSRHLSFEGRATAMGKLARLNFDVELHFEPRDVVKAAVAIARDKGIKRETLEHLLSAVRIDVTAFGWVTILPTWVWLSASSLLPMNRPLLGTADRLLPIQFAALPDSSLLNVGTIAVPSAALFDTSALALGVHWSRFGRATGYSLTLGGLGVPSLEQFGKNWGKAFSVYGYADLYYVKRVSRTVDLGIGFTYALDLFGERAGFGPPHLYHQEAKHQPWLPGSRENVAPAEDRSGHRMMFTLKGTHDLLGR